MSFLNVKNNGISGGTGFLKVGASSLDLISTLNQYLDYNLYINFLSSTRDKVSGQQMTTVLSPGRMDNAGNEFGENEPVIDENGLNTYGPYENLITYSEETSNWTGSGPWTQAVNLEETGIYTISTSIAGATITVTAGTATIDAGASATQGSPDQFEVTGIGTVTISSDIADPKAQLTKTTYRLPYVKTEASTVVVPQNYSDADEGYKFQIMPDPVGSPYTGPGGTRNMGMPLVLDALDGAADGAELVTNGDCTNSPTINGVGLGSSGVNFSLTSDQFHSGTKSIKVTDTNVLENGSIRFESGSACGLVVGKRYEKSVWVFIPSGQSLTKLNLAVQKNSGSIVILDQTTVFNQWVKLTGRFTEDGSQRIFYVVATGDVTPTDVWYIDSFSLSEISPAQGEMVVEWIPMFDYTVPTIQRALFTVTDESIYPLRYNLAGKIVIDDYTTGLATNDSIEYSVGTRYTIKTIFGTHPTEGANKMQLIVTDGTTTWESNVTAFDGSFDPLDFLSFGWTNEYWQAIKSIKIYKEPQSW